MRRRDGSLIVLYLCECVSVCVCTLRRRANGNVLFNLTVFSLDRRSEIQVIDATVWYSPSCARFTAGTAAFKSARTRGNGRCDLTLLTASEVFFGDLVSAASQHTHTHVRARSHTRTVWPATHLHKQRIHPKSPVRLPVTRDVPRLRTPLPLPPFIPHYLSQ